MNLLDADLLSTLRNYRVHAVEKSHDEPSRYVLGYQAEDDRFLQIVFPKRTQDLLTAVTFHWDELAETETEAWTHLPDAIKQLL